MIAALNRPESMRIVTAMNKSVWMVAVLLAVALSASAQSNEFGILFGGSKPLKSAAGKGSFETGVREIYYGIELDPATIFKIKLGRMSTATSFATDQKDAKGKTIFDTDPKGSIEHADGIIEYRFSESYGYTGLFAGAGMYRQRGNGHEESDFGLQAGISGLFPLSRRYSIVAEGTYHWMNFYRPRPRYVTIAAGLRMAF